MSLEVREAIKAAKTYVSRLYEGDEAVTNLDLEETDYDAKSGRWRITIGLSRPFAAPRTRASEVLARLGEGPQLRRSYKVVTIDRDGQVLSMKDRALEHG